MSRERTFEELEPGMFQKHRVEILKREEYQRIGWFLDHGWTVVQISELSGGDLLFVLGVPEVAAREHLQRCNISREESKRRAKAKAPTPPIAGGLDPNQFRE